MMNRTFETSNIGNKSIRPENISNLMLSLKLQLMIMCHGPGMYKPILVAKGYKQKYVADFDEIFSLAFKMTTLRTILGLVAAKERYGAHAGRCKN